jgi:hypothetical protein
VDLLVLFDFELAFGSFLMGFWVVFFEMGSLKVKVSLLWTQGWRRMWSLSSMLSSRVEWCFELHSCHRPASPNESHEKPAPSTSTMISIINPQTPQKPTTKSRNLSEIHQKHAS